MKRIKIIFLMIPRRLPNFWRMSINQYISITNEIIYLIQTIELFCLNV